MFPSLLQLDGIKNRIVRNVSMFKRWCAEQKFDHGGNKLSHVAHEWGVLSVPSDRLSEFYDKYIESVLSGEKIYVVEQKTKYYNFFVDIDYKAEEALNLNDIQDICKIICNKVMTKGGRECLISVAQPKPAGDKIKTGVHLNFPGFVVDQKSAIALREHILVALYIAKGSEDWESIIDSAVYGDITKRSEEWFQNAMVAQNDKGYYRRSISAYICI